MDFNLNDEQELFVAGIRELMASENWEAYFAECDRDSVYPERFVKALADMGIDSLLIPEEHGGLDAGFVTLAAVWMELGRLGAPTYVLYQLPGGFNTFLREGTQEQIDKIMAFRGTGKQMWNSAITEPGAGSDVGSLKTTYTRRNGKIYLFGEAIGRFQLIQEKFAHMAIKLNSMKNMLYEAAWKADNGTITSGDAAMCKYFCANAAFEVVDSAMQVLGGVGIAGNHRISRFWRDLRVDRVSGGSDEMQILTLGRAVLKQYR
ncbi:acyl-CoA dehydrogenase family protein [Escherichia coli]